MDLQTIIANRDTIKAWEPEKAQTFLSMAFDHYVAPKLGGQISDLDSAKAQWVGSFLGKPTKLPENLEKPPADVASLPSTFQKALGACRP